MSDAEIEAAVASIRKRLEQLATEAERGAPVAAAEIGQIRAQLRELAAANEQVGARLAKSLGLRNDS